MSSFWPKIWSRFQGLVDINIHEVAHVNIRILGITATQIQNLTGGLKYWFCSIWTKSSRRASNAHTSLNFKKWFFRLEPFVPSNWSCSIPILFGYHPYIYSLISWRRNFGLADLKPQFDEFFGGACGRRQFRYRVLLKVRIWNISLSSSSQLLKHQGWLFFIEKGKRYLC